MFHQGLCGIAWPFHVFWPLPLAKELLTIRPPVGISEVSRVPEKKVSGIRNIQFEKMCYNYNEGTSDFYNTTDYLIGMIAVKHLGYYSTHHYVEVNKMTTIKDYYSNRFGRLFYT